MCLQFAAINHGDVPASIADDAAVMQFTDFFGDGLTTYTEHGGNCFLGDLEITRRLTVKTGQQPAAELLVYRMVPVAYGVV